MAGTVWTSEEVSLLLFLATRDIQPEIIADMLNNRTTTLLSRGAAQAPRRTTSAVRGKLIWIKARHPEIWLEDGSIDVAMMMEFLYSLPFVDPAELNMLLYQATMEINLRSTR